MGQRTPANQEESRLSPSQKRNSSPSQLTRIPMYEHFTSDTTLQHESTQTSLISNKSIITDKTEHCLLYLFVLKRMRILTGLRVGFTSSCWHKKKKKDTILKTEKLFLRLTLQRAHLQTHAFVGFLINAFFFPPQITQLKIDHNPFAKGFRDNYDT